MNFFTGKDFLHALSTTTSFKLIFNPIIIIPNPKQTYNKPNCTTYLPTSNRSLLSTYLEHNSDKRFLLILKELFNNFQAPKRCPFNILLLFHNQFFVHSANILRFVRMTETNMDKELQIKDLKYDKKMHI